MANKEPKKNKPNPKNLDEIDRQAREAVKKIFEEMRAENKREEQILPPPPRSTPPLFSNPNLGAWNDFLRKVEEEARAIEAEQDKTLVQDVADALVPVLKAQAASTNEKLTIVDNVLTNLVIAQAQRQDLLMDKLDAVNKNIENSTALLKRETETSTRQFTVLANFTEDKARAAQFYVEKYEKWFVLGMCVPALLGILNLILLLSK